VSLGKIFGVNRRSGKPPSGPTWLFVVMLVPTLGCAPRQARVESDPRGPGGEAVRRQLEELARTDLDALNRAEAAHFADARAYTYDTEALGFSASPGVRVSVLEATDGGFSALAQAGSIECGVFIGSADPPRSYTRTAGVVSCRS